MRPRLSPGPTRGFLANIRVASPFTDKEAGECTSLYEGVYSLASWLLSSFARGIHYEKPVVCILCLGCQMCCALRDVICKAHFLGGSTMVG